jgi:hypothetical protein
VRGDFINKDREKEAGKAIVCAREKGGRWEGMGEGDYRRRGKISYLGDARTVERYMGKRKGETGTWGKGREKASG